MNQLLPFRYRLLAALVLCALFLGIGLEHTPRPVQAAVGSQFDYVDNASFGIDFDEDTNGCNNWMERSINVPDDLIILDVDFGFRAWHDYRGDIKVLLRSPAGTEVLVIDGESADNNHSYDVLLDDDSPNPLDDEDDDPIITFNGFPPSVGITTENPSSYDRTAQPSNPLTAFVGERAQGTWRVYICDDANNDDGRYFHSLIRLTGFHTVDSQLEAHWPLDETAITNTTADVSGNGHTGTKVNMAGWSTNTPPAIRFPNPAAQNFGLFSRIDTSGAIDLANRSFTVSFWARRANSGNYHVIVSQGTDSPNRGLHIAFRPNNRFTCAFWADDLDTPNTYTDTDWHHWTCTYDVDNNRRTIYRDGVQVAQDTASADYQGTGQVRIGDWMDPSLDRSFQGTLDDVRIYRRALTASEVAALAAGSAGCYARPNNGAIFSSIDAKAVQTTLDGLGSGGTARLAGVCVGAEPTGGGTQIARATRNMTLEGGWNTTFTSRNPANTPTILDANGGGRVLYVSSSTVTVRDLTLTGGQASSGAGIYNANGTLTVRNSTLHNNRASGSGGGIYTSHSLSFPPTTRTTVVNSTLSNNEAGSSGGAIVNVNHTVDIEHSTITGNRANNGGGVATLDIPNNDFFVATTNVRSSILVGNSNGDVVSVLGVFNSNGYNLVGAGNATGSFNQVFDRVGIADAGLGPLQDNGGGAWTHALLEGSPALEAGACRDSANNPVSNDQRGQSRPGAGSTMCDAGAVEIQNVVAACFARLAGGAILSSANSRAVQEAVNNLGAGGGTVQIAGTCGGTWRMNGHRQVVLLDNDVTLQGGWDSGFTTHNPAQNITTLDAQRAGRVLYLQGSANANVLDLILTGGAPSGDNGGGVHVEAGVTAAFTNTQVVHNVSPLRGGGIYNRGTLSLAHSAVISNTARPLPILWLPLDEAAGATTFVDVSGHGHDGSCGGGDPSGSCPSAGAPGVRDRAAAFDGADDLIMLENSPDLTQGTHAQRTVAVWFQVDDSSINSRKQIVYEEGGGDRGLNLYVHGGRLYAGGWNTPGNESGWGGTFLSTDAIESGRWHHAALVLDGTASVTADALAFYLDGQLVDSGAGSQVWQHTGGIGVGGMNQNTRFHDGAAGEPSGHGFAGWIDDLHLYNRPLPAQEIHRLFAHGHPGGAHGGGLYNDGSLAVMETSIVANSAGEGGGLYTSSPITIADSSLSANQAIHGGGLYLDSDTAALRQTALIFNRAEQGGGLYLAGGLLSAINSTVSSNVAEQGGGVHAAGGELDLRFATLAHNEGTAQGDNVHNDGAAIKLLATVIADPASGQNCSGSTPLTSNSGYNRISDLSCRLQNAIAAPDEAEDRENVEAIRLGNLADNGGPTLTHKPDPDPAVVDIMDSFVCQNFFPAGPAVDQRGRGRPSQGIREEGVFVPEEDWRCDAGAVELGAEQHRVCGAPLFVGYNQDNDPVFTDNLRCDVPTVDAALQVAQTGDTIVVAGVVTETVTVSKSVTIRGPEPLEITPGTHMGVVQASLLPPNGGSATGSVFTIDDPNLVVTIEDLNIRHGDAAQGGGIRNAGDLTLDGVTLYASRAVSGAAVYNEGTLHIANSTVVSNTATAGGVIHSSGSTGLAFVTLAGNSGTNVHDEGGGTSVAGSILSGGSACVGAVTSGGGNLIHGSGCLAGDATGDPQLGPLRDNGGPTLTRAIPAGSPAADNAACTVETDQRGRARPDGASCDSGAVEHAPAVLTVCANCEPDPAALRFTDLQEALDAAMAGDTIDIHAGVYTGNFTAYRDVTLRHAGIDVTTLSQEQAVDVRAILQASDRSLSEQQRLRAPAGTVLTVQGYAPLAETGSIVPTGDVSVTLHSLTLRRGMARQGGGIYNLGRLAIVKSTLAENAAVNRWSGTDNAQVAAGDEARGGAIYNAGQLTLQRSTISGNQSEYYAGAIYSAGRGDGIATTLLDASTVAENRAERLSRQHVMVIDNDILGTGEVKFINPVTETLSGDEILFQNKVPFDVTLVVDGTGCNRTSLTVTPASLSSEGLICSTSQGDNTITIRSDKLENLTTDVTVHPLSIAPVAHALYAADDSDVTARHSIVVNSTGSGANCAGSADQARWSIRSGNYNLVNDGSCGFAEDGDLRPTFSGTLQANLGPLQDNNVIDFQAGSISGYAHTHALRPDSPAIDRIPPEVCQAASQVTVDLAGGSANVTVDAGDIVQWRHTQRVTLVINDGEANARLIELTGDSAPFTSAALQFVDAGVYPYRIYAAATFQEIGAGTLTVRARTRLDDQRGMLLPQRGFSGRHHCDVGAYEFQPWIVGQPLPRPPAAVGNQSPDWALGGTGIDNEDPPYHAWSAATLQEFALRPSPNDGDTDLEAQEMIALSWKVDPNPAAAARLTQVGIVEWPDAPQVHVSGAPVNLLHNHLADEFVATAARAFEGREPVDDAAGALLDGSVFSRDVLPAIPGDSYSVVQFARGNQANVTLKVQVVKTWDWNTPGLRDVRAAATVCTLGTALDYTTTNAAGELVAHADPEGGTGYVLAGLAYDGVLTAAEQTLIQNTTDGLIPPVYVRETRAGWIIPILNTAPTAFADPDPLSGDHDLRVAWYRPDGRNLAWPVKSVGYRCDWPADPPQIVIASELGSEIGGQALLGSDLYADPTVYHQPDPDVPGFNPNDEHALLAASNLGNSAPALYALRTDLAEQPHALLKYRDPREDNRPKIAIYEVLLTRSARDITGFTTVSGTVTLLPGATAGVAARAAEAAAASGPDVTLRVGSGDLPAGGEVTVPVEALGARNLRSVVLRVAYDPAQLTPTSCTPNRLDWVEAPTGLQVGTDGPVRPQRVIHMQARLDSGTDVQYTWDFGDGTTRIAGTRVSHVYGAAGDYTVTVTAGNGQFADVTATAQVEVAADAVPGSLDDNSTSGCRVETDGGQSELVLELRSRDKHGLSGSLVLADLTFEAVGGAPAAETPTTLDLAVDTLAGPDYEELRYEITAGNPVFAPVPLRNLLDVQSCEQTRAADLAAKPFWKDFKGALWARAAGDMDVLYYYPLQAGFHLSANQAAAVGLGELSEDQRVGQCVPWLHDADPNVTVEDGDVRVYPVAYHASWPDLPALLTVGETVYERPKGGISGVATQLAVSRIYDDEAPGIWNDEQQKVEIGGEEAARALAQLVDPMAEVRVPLAIEFDGNPSLPITIKSERLLFGAGQSILGTTDYEVILPFALRSRITFDDSRGELVFEGYYDGASPQYITGDPLLLFNVMSQADRTRLRLLCEDEQGNLRPDSEPALSQCAVWLETIDTLYHKTRNPRQIDLCRRADGALFDGDPEPAINQGSEDPSANQNACPAGTYRDGAPDQAFLIDLQDANDDGVPEPFEGLGKGKALTAGNADGTGYVTLAYNNDPSLGGLPVSLQVVQVGCTLNHLGEDSTYRGNVLVIESDNLFDEKLTLRHTGDFGGRPDQFEFEWYIAEVDETAVSPTARPPAYPWRSWTKIEPGASQIESEITIEGANPTTLSDNWLIVRYKGYQACGNQYVWSAFAGDPSAKPSEVRAQLAPGWIKRVTSGLNPFDARVDDFVSAPVNTTVDMVRQAGRRYEGPIALSNDPEVLNNIGLIEGYQTVLDRGRTLSIDSNINHQGANAALLNVTSRIADLYMLLGNAAYVDALDPTVGLNTSSEFASRAPAIFAFMNQFRPDQFGLIDEELALLRGRDETLGGVAAAPLYNRLTWNFTNGEGEVAYVQNYNLKDWNEDGFVNEADAALQYPQGHGDAWGHMLTAIGKYYELLRHPFYTWIPRAEPIGVAGAPVVVDYYDERRFAIAAATKARMGSEIVDLTYRKHYAEPESQPYRDEQVDPSDGTRRAWGVADWAQRAGQGAYFDWLVANAILPPVDDRYSDVRKIDRTTVLEIDQIAGEYLAIQQHLDDADAGMNPLGLVGDAVLFDLDPAAVADGETHFEQVYARSLQSLNNAKVLFDYANEMKLAQREGQDASRDFTQSIVDQDRALINELIEIFGYPYDADLGVNGTYPEGYDGPDIYNYDLWDRVELTDHQKRCSDEVANDPARCPPETKTILVEYGPIPCIGFLVQDLDPSNVCEEFEGTDLEFTKTIEHRVGIGLDAGRGRFKPSAWPETSARKAPGEIQNALQALNQARLEYEQAILDYQNQVIAITAYQGAIERRTDFLELKRDLTIAEKTLALGASTAVQILKQTVRVLNQFKETTKDIGDASQACANIIAGFSNSVGIPAICTAGISTTATRTGVGISITVLEGIQDALGYFKEVNQFAFAMANLDLNTDWELQQLALQVNSGLRKEQQLRLALFLAKDKVNAAQGDYDQTLQRGFRKLQELIRLRKRWAGQITEQRYNDMAYRTFMIDALQKYRRQFDLAQQYVYLTAAAYDYETNLALDDTANGNRFLREIVGERGLGEIRTTVDFNITPIAGSPGLADPLARMIENFGVLKGQMGFNNPQLETNRFSLRNELFRLRDGSDASWRQELMRYYTPDIYSHDDVARLASRPFGETGPTPGLVIPFDSVVYDRLNFFGHPLGPGDSAYDASQFATKIAGVGVWFEGYDTGRLSQTPRIYLLPAGKDVIRPRNTSGRLRYWNVVEQLLPLPHPIGPAEMEDPTWIPRIDGLNGSLYATKPYARFRAYPYTEEFDPTSLNHDTRLIGRSVWNTEWLLVIPGSTLLADPQQGLERFIEDVRDIYVYFETYAYAGTGSAREAEE